MNKPAEVTIGQRFGRLVLLAKGPTVNGRHSTFEAICDCGKKKTIRRACLIRGESKSCGCLQRELRRAIPNHKTHGMRRTREYATWRNMKTRCLNSNVPEFAHYGGRGITICNRWLDSFENFYADMGPKPIGMQLDRIDNDGNYAPDNCKWSTHSEQQKNRRPFHRSQR